MALLFTPHTLIAYPRTKSVDATTKVTTLVEGLGATVLGYVRPERRDIVVDQQTGVELKNPHRVFLNLGDVASFPYGARVVWQDTGQQFRVASQADRMNAGGVFAVVDHGRVDMELLEVV